MINQNIFLAQTVNFILLVILLYRLLYKPVRAFLDNRTAEIQGQIKTAEENQAAAIALRQELEEQTRDSKLQARQYLDAAVKRAELLQAEMLQEAKEEAAAIIRRAQEANELEREKAWAELKEQVGELSLLLASKVISKSLDQDQHQALIDQTLGQLDAVGEGRPVQ
ncbi:MAG: F0F1 ATP synthase subunit B [Bacillota bacterium]|nr:F0F1 ATP synthase subunit B [Bacillota bacterium]HHT90292.1 F0F1 ATP synthase subunit B [Bacillota bacterium]